MWVLIAFIVVFAVGCFVFHAWYSARFETQNAPRIRMFTCDKHGVFPEKYAFDSSDVLFTTEDHQKVCPLCLKDAEKLAMERYVKRTK